MVLSACETGLGEVAGGEGVYGLQRAFHLAGVQTTVASLWQVDDEITQELLTQFFENLWHKGLGRLEALRQAQLAVRHGEGNRAQPRYWAAWVLSGDPGNLGDLPSAVVAEAPPVAAVAPWWSGWLVHAVGIGVFGVLILGLVALRSVYPQAPQIQALRLDRTSPLNSQASGFSSTTTLRLCARLPWPRSRT